MWPRIGPPTESATPAVEWIIPVSDPEPCSRLSIGTRGARLRVTRFAIAQDTRIAVAAAIAPNHGRILDSDRSLGPPIQRISAESRTNNRANRSASHANQQILPTRTKNSACPLISFSNSILRRQKSSPQFSTKNSNCNAKAVRLLIFMLPPFDAASLITARRSPLRPTTASAPTHTPPAPRARFRHAIERLRLARTNFFRPPRIRPLRASSCAPRLPSVEPVFARSHVNSASSTPDQQREQRQPQLPVNHRIQLRQLRHWPLPAAARAIRRSFRKTRTQSGREKSQPKCDRCLRRCQNSTAAVAHHTTAHANCTSTSASS